MNTDILRRWYEHGESERILTALKKTPTQQPEALFYAAGALIDLGREDEAKKQLEKALTLTKDENLKADLLALHSFIQARQGDFLGYIEGAERAAQLKHTPLTLYHLGLASTDPEKGLEALHTALKSAEMVRDEYASTRNAFALAVPLLRLGRYQEALHWLRYSELRCHHNGLRMALLYTRACVQIFLGEVDGLADELRGALDQYGSSHPWIQEPLSTALADLFQVEERYEEALAIYQRWLIESPRSGWIRLTHGAVRALTKLQRLEEAQRLAQTASVVADDVMTYRADAQLVVGLSLWPRREAETHLLSAYRAFKGKIVPRATEAALHLTALYQLQGKHAEAHHIFAQSQPSLKELGVTGLKLLGGRALDLLELPFDARSVPHAFLLGRRDVLEAGSRLALRPRGLEILALLLAYPEGLSGRSLEYGVYGREGVAALRVEIFRLKKALGIEIKNGPYRLAVEIKSDYREVDRLLKKGDIWEAVHLYRGPLLPDSTAPGIENLRVALEQQLVESVLATADLDLAWELAQVLSDNLRLWEFLLRFPETDQRLYTVKGRVAVLRSELNLEEG